MRSKNKYKIYNQAGSLPESFHQRVLNFKRPKWKKIQRLISQTNYSQKSLINNLSVRINFKSWEKIKSYYNVGLKNKSTIYNYFDCGIKIKHINESLKKSQNYQIQDNFLKCIVKPEFRVDFLLSRLGFFSTSFQAKQFIDSKKILVNGKIIGGNFFLKKGDVITLSHFINVNIDQTFKYFSPTKKIFSFIEVDYYSNTIIITKNLSDLHLEDMHLLSVNHCDLKKIKDFL